MATPYQPKKRVGLGPLSSGGSLEGTGGGSYTGAQSGTGFTNAQDLLAANAGKGKAMFGAIPGLSDEDEASAVAGLNELTNYDPTGALKTDKGISREYESVRGVNGIGQTVDNIYQRPWETTEYTGLSAADIDSRADKLRGLKNKFQDFSSVFSQGDGGAEARGQALAASMQKTQPLYTGSKGQGAFDSFLVESEAAPMIQSNSDRLKSLMGKFDGFDKSVDTLKGRIGEAQGKVGTKYGDSQLTRTDLIPEVTPIYQPPQKVITPESPAIDRIRASGPDITSYTPVENNANAGNVMTQAEWERRMNPVAPPPPSGSGGTTASRQRRQLGTQSASR